MSHKKKVFDISLVPNDVLRPWTMDLILDENIHDEVERLNKTISCTSPQKKAGVRGDSILDGMQNTILEHEGTIRRPAWKESFTETKVPSKQPSRENSRGPGIKFAETLTEVSPRAQSESHLSESEIADEEYISRLQESMMKKSSSTKKLSKTPSLTSIKYTPNLSPAVLNVSHSEFERLKMMTPK